MSQTISDQTLITQLFNKLEKQQALMEEQQAEIQQLKAGLERVKQILPNSSISPADTVKVTTSRRKMLKKVVLSTAGLAALGAMNGMTNVNTAQAGKGIFGASTDSNGVEGNSASATSSGIYGENSSTGYGVYGLSPKGIGVQGNSSDGTAIRGDSITNYGVVGYSKDGTAIRGDSTSSIGVMGSSSNHNGVEGHAGSAYKSGVYGENTSTSGVGIFGISPKGIGVQGSSSDGTAIRGDSNSNYGVVGYSVDGTAIRGDSTSSIGVIGYSTNHNGVEGHSSSATHSGMYGENGSTGVGVYGYSAGGIGIVGNGQNGLGANFAGGLAPMRLMPASASGSPNNGNHNIGEFYVDSNGVLYYCIADGSPGNWVILSNPGGGGGTNAPALNLLATPVRIVDTLSGTTLNNSTGTLNGFGPISGGNTSTVNSNTRNYAGRGGTSGIPGNASAITGYIYCNTQSKNFSIKAGYGYLTVWKQGSAYPLASQTQGIVSLYYSHGVSYGTAFTVGLSGSDEFSVASDTTTDIIIDVFGYYL